MVSRCLKESSRLERGLSRLHTPFATTKSIRTPLQNSASSQSTSSSAQFSTTSTSMFGPRKLSQTQRTQNRRAEQKDRDARAMEKNFNREWKAGDIYAPHDLSGAEARKWKTKRAPTTDAFDALSLNPLDCYKNFSIMSEYMSEMGRIRHSRETGLRPVNQRKIAKAIRRAIAIGLMPSVHKHPEVLRRSPAFTNAAQLVSL